MKKSQNFLRIALMTGMIMLALFGCGRKEGTEGGGKSGYVYVPEYVQIDIECDHIYDAVAAGDNLFLSGVSWNDDTGENKNYLYKYNMIDKQMQEISIDLDTDSSISSMTVAPDGKLMILINRYTYEQDEEGNVTNAESAIELWDVSPEDGSVGEKKDITKLAGDSEYAYIQYFCVDGQGNIYVSDGDNGIHVVKQDLSPVCDIKLDNWIQGMMPSKEGDIYISSYGENGLELRPVDLNGKKLGEAVEGMAGGYGNTQYYTGVSQSLVTNSSDQVSLFDLSSGTSEPLFKWLDADIDGNEVSEMGELSDGRIWAIVRNNSESASTGGNTYEVVFLTRTEASKVEAKKEILLGTMWLDSNLKKGIIDFNKTNGQYRITVKEYGGGDDYMEGLNQFNADLTTANCPDMISLSNIDFEQYASKGILEDLYPYMEKSGFKKEDYLENILKAYESDGRLCGILPQFYISTTMAKASLVGDKTGWTLSEMLDFVEENEPENIFSDGTRSSIFYYCIYNNIDEFIDWQNGKCFFDGEDFIRTLEFAANFPEEYDYSREGEGISSKIRSNKLLLMQSTISSVQEYQMMNGMFGEKIAFVGYPNSERKGNLIQATGGCIGLSAKSKNKDGAWEFMQRLLSDEYQDSLVSEHGSWGFPVKKSALEKQFEIDMTPDFYEDEEGNKIESPKTTWGWDDFEMEIMAATQEEIDAVKEIIASADKLSGNVGVNEQLTSIITEESEPFFKGQKSAADVAGIIQNRIQIYVNENR